MKMKKETKRNIGIAAVAVMIVLFSTKLILNKNAVDAKVYRYDVKKNIFVSAEKIGYKKIDKMLSYTGMFEPNKETRVSAEVQGKINEYFVDAGSVVTKGQSLIQLDNTLLNLQLQSLEVQIKGLQSDVQRYTVLAKAEAVQGVQLEKVELALQSAIIQKNSVLEQIKRTTIVAPFNGVVTAKLSEIGAFAAPGIPLLQITDISRLKFTINVSETDLRLFKTNQSYNVFADVYPEKVLQGRITLIGSKGNNANSYPIQFSVQNTNGFEIKSGMFGKVNIQEGNEQNQISISASSIVGSNVKPQVYLIKNGKAALHTISISKRIDNKVIVSSGLNEGDIIVKGGFINLYDGANVVFE
jgi:RND family efflux transporter MFP subunit